MEKKATVLLLLKGIILANLSIFQMGYSNAFPNTAIRGFKEMLTRSHNTTAHSGNYTENDFHWEWSALLNVYFIGFAVGSWIAVPIADRIGRKWCLVAGNSVNLIAATMATLAVALESALLFLIYRVIFAIAAAISMNSLILLLQESSPPHLRGIMSFNAEMAFVVMNMVGAVAGMRIALGENILMLVGVACIPTLLSLLLALYFHESPKYLLIAKNNKSAARKSLKFYQGLDENSPMTSRVLSTMECEKSEGGSSVRDVFRSPHTVFGLLLGIVTLQMTSSLWPILYFSTELLQRAGIDYDTAELLSVVMLLVSTTSTVVGMFVVERLPRRSLLLGSATVNVTALLIFVISERLHLIVPSANIGCVIAIVLHGTSYSIGLGPIAWFITAELVPLQHRAFCQSVALSVNQLGVLVLCFITLPLYNIFGSLIILLLFVIPGYICVALLYNLLPETRGREIDDVIAQMPKSIFGIKLTKARVVDAQLDCLSDKAEE